MIGSNIQEKQVFQNGDVNQARGFFIFKSVFYVNQGDKLAILVILKQKTEMKKSCEHSKITNGQHASLVQLDEVVVCVGDEIEIGVDTEFRSSVCVNHSVTHLLNEALRRVLGNHVIQQGSSVTKC